MFLSPDLRLVPLRFRMPSAFALWIDQSDIFVCLNVYERLFGRTFPIISASAQESSFPYSM
jgi:hypothetical protein